MTCRDVIDFLIDYCDDALGDSERAVFDAHLAQCPDCRAYLQAYRQTLRLAKDAFSESPAEMPAALVQAILAARRRAL